MMSSKVWNDSSILEYQEMLKRIPQQTFFGVSDTGCSFAIGLLGRHLGHPLGVKAHEPEGENKTCVNKQEII